MAKKSGSTYYPKSGENRTGISYDEGRTYQKADYNPGDVPLGRGSLSEAAKLLKKNRDKGMGADIHRKD